MENLKEVAIFAGGCFWCVESDLQKIPSVIDAESGFIGGKGKPTYEQVASGNTDFREAVRVIFEPEKTSYRKLVEYFFTKHDPTDVGGSFADLGYQYTSAIYYLNEEQRKTAEDVKQKIGESGLFGNPIVTEVLEAGDFYRAEDYHQNYSKKNPDHYEAYRISSGREDFLTSMKQK